MKLTLPLISLLISLSAQAGNTVDVEMTKDWKIWLRGASCSELNPQLNAFASWRSKLGESQPASSSYCSCSGARCKVEITQLLPQYVKKVLGIFPENDGPNCWNTALVASGILPYMRGTEAEEFSYWVDHSPLCQERAPGSKPEPGDIMAIRSNYGKVEQHAFVYASDELSFSKKTFEAAEPYRLVSLREIYGHPFNVKETCVDIGNKTCETQVHAYRCQSMKQYLIAHPVSEQTALRLTEVEANEKQLEAKLFTTSDHFQKSIAKIALQQSQEIKLDLSRATPESTDSVILKGLELRTQSIESAMTLLK